MLEKEQQFTSHTRGQDSLVSLSNSNSEDGERRYLVFFCLMTKIAINVCLN